MQISKRSEMRRTHTHTLHTSFHQQCRFMISVAHYFCKKKNTQKIYQMRKDIACVRIMDIFRAIKKIYYNLKR